MTKQKKKNIQKAITALNLKTMQTNYITKIVDRGI